MSEIYCKYKYGQLCIHNVFSLFHRATVRRVYIKKLLEVEYIKCFECVVIRSLCFSNIGRWLAFHFTKFSYIHLMFNSW